MHIAFDNNVSAFRMFETAAKMPHFLPRSPSAFWRPTSWSLPEASSFAIMTVAKTAAASKRTVSGDQGYSKSHRRGGILIFIEASPRVTSSSTRPCFEARDRKADTRRIITRENGGVALRRGSCSPHLFPAMQLTRFGA